MEESMDQQGKWCLDNCQNPTNFSLVKWIVTSGRLLCSINKRRTRKRKCFCFAVKSSRDERWYRFGSKGKWVLHLSLSLGHQGRTCMERHLVQWKSLCVNVSYSSGGGSKSQRVHCVLTKGSWFYFSCNIKELLGEIAVTVGSQATKSSLVCSGCKVAVIVLWKVDEKPSGKLEPLALHRSKYMFF